MDYRPAPRDTCGVKLPWQIAELTELLARKPRRDDAKKEHDGTAAMETILAGLSEIS